MKWFLSPLAVMGIVIGVAYVGSSAQSIEGHEIIKLWPKGAPEGQADTKAETTRIAPGGDHVITHVSETFDHTLSTTTADGDRSGP